MAGEYGIFFGERMPPGWLVPALLVLALILSTALVVMVLISGADFHDQPSRVPKPTPGACEPFCTATTPQPVPPR
ncbi:hypothetical protein [Nocardia transvalensis]|uniref:hypothetical protein n=1 Tax=Nocardia transvalensis TaxID=37333 RepID=UPI00189630ED|nr:hypothetical protein [Nocardia transvalensis]MBF6327306.1 hypothetical protein [Nocardia transvalensis]